MVVASTELVALKALVRRSGARGTRGAVACAAPAAAAAGTAALLDGGNCVDAALTAALVETVALPPKCGLAGDVVGLYLSPASEAPVALVSIGRAASGLAGEVQARGELPVTGGLSVGVPGAPAGYAALATKARFDLSRLCAPAAALARRGIVWTEQCAALAAEADELLVRLQPGGCGYRPRSGPLPAGTRLPLPGLARVLDDFAHRGAALFRGPVGEALAATAASDGGVLSMGDMANAEAEWAPAPHARIGESTVWSTPGPTFGPALLASLLQVRDGRAPLPDVVRGTLHRQARSAGDGVALDIEGTSVVAATDAEGGAVVIVHSNSFPQFGSGLVIPDFDLVLSNRAGRGFAADPDRPNFPDAGRRPLTTLHCWGLRHDERMLLGGTPGGAQQVPWNAQVLTRLLDGLGPGEAVCEPLWRLDGPETIAEPGATEGADRTVPGLTMQSAQVVVAPPAPGGTATAWADPRAETLAVAV